MTAGIRLSDTECDRARRQNRCQANARRMRCCRPQTALILLFVRLHSVFRRLWRRQSFGLVSSSTATAVPLPPRGRLSMSANIVYTGKSRRLADDFRRAREMYAHVLKRERRRQQAPTAVGAGQGARSPCRSPQ